MLTFTNGLEAEFAVGGEAKLVSGRSEGGSPRTGLLEVPVRFIAWPQGVRPTTPRSTSTRARSVAGIRNVPSGIVSEGGAVGGVVQPICRWRFSPTQSETDGDGPEVSVLVTAATIWPVVAM
jgi:hypothetical protein